MSITETITIVNNGNAAATFRWIYNQTNGLYIPYPPQDEIPPKSAKTAKITFTPNSNKPELETLTMKIDDGVNQDIVCTAVVNEARCEFVGRQMVDFGNVPVGIRSKEETIEIKNKIRNDAVF
mmetsp:Transcript_43631/g.42144  ORF Transcript_43631/g.42144 Transcript_43631/m.42144 type:complete len:123 (+) Transcript_43631:601-969(+)